VAGYTIRNLKHDVEDQAPKFDLSPQLEARFAGRDLELGELGMSYQRLAPNFRVPFGHKHEGQEEVYLVLGGSGRIKLDDEVVELKPWDAVRIANDTMRCVEAGDEGIEFVAIGAPFEGSNDVEMTPGWWAD
jgi:uncharacterized cupin superfamily protein